jgi:cell wall-associated NlpC family hydrolase
MARRSLLVALALALPSVAAPRQSVLEYVRGELARDRGFTPAQRTELLDALRDRFANYGLNVVRPDKPQDVQTLLHVVAEGMFDHAPMDRIADVAFAAYQAVWRGAPAEVVQGIALYGFRKPVAPEMLAAWANGYRVAVKGGVPDEVAADLVRNAMEGGWDVRTFDTVKWGLVDAARRKYDVKLYAAYVFAGMEKDRQHPGALLGRTRARFEDAARKKTVPDDPGYRGVFDVDIAPHRARPDASVSETQRKPPDKPAPPDETERPPEPPRAREGEGPFSSWARVERTALSYLGTPYVWGGETRAGIDCSGLTRNSYRAIEVPLPRVSKLQWKSGAPVKKESLREGDLVFFDTNGSGVSHVGMVIDPRTRRIIHASSSHGVVEADMDEPWFQSRYLGARRVAN